ncbi:hypothetical protein [Streptococcus sp. DD12]|nr:hypothetical protein [Streptococcus sp. DD12]KXT76991.1 hypothetical protein STRDD12_00125 [Streptococcus sp. DD12]
MNLSTLFFILSAVMSLIFTLGFVTLFICYVIISNRVNKNFKAVRK